MEVAFMACRVRLQIECALLVTVLCFGCTEVSPGPGLPSVPEIWAEQQDTGWIESQGILFLNGTPFSGWKYAIGQANDTLFLGGFVNGFAEGKHLSKYENGQWSEVRHYRKGRQEGTVKRWYENGQIAFEASLLQDHYEGQVRTWYENGNPHEQFQYSNGRENGRQQRWDEQRNVLANYEVRNGRKYGLSGTKNCVSSMVVDSAGMDGR